MALLIIYEKGSGPDTAWFVGQDIELTHDRIRHIDHVQADGDELFHIVMRFKNLPQIAAGLVPTRWFGDHAKFIVANL